MGWGGRSYIGVVEIASFVYASAKISKREGNISPSSLYGLGVNQANEEGRRF